MAPDSSGITRYLPLFLVFMSGIGFSIQTLFIKLLEERGFSATFRFIFSRGFIQLIIASYFILTDHSIDKPKLFGDSNRVRIILFCRSFFGYVSVAFSFLTVERLPVGDATVLVMLSPLFASIGAYFILRESWRFPELVATIISLAGVVFVARPPFIFHSGGSHDARYASADVVGVLFGMIASITAGLAYVCVRILGTSAKMPWYNVVFAQALGQVLFTVPNLYLVEGSMKLSITFIDVVLIIGGGFIGAWSQIAMTYGMQREKSASATAMRMSDVVFGFIWQVLFTSDSFNLLSAFGASLVTSSILIIVFCKEKESISSNSSYINGDLSNSNSNNNSNSYNSYGNSKQSNIELGYSVLSKNSNKGGNVQYSPLASVEAIDNEENEVFDSQIGHLDTSDAVKVEIDYSLAHNNDDNRSVRSIYSFDFGEDLSAAFEQETLPNEVTRSNERLNVKSSGTMLSKWKSYVRNKLSHI